MVEHILKCHDIIDIDFVRGEDCFLYDALGKRYVDFESGIWCTALGHCHPRVQRALETQSRQVVHLGTRFPNHVVEEAARAVLDITGLDGKCVFLSSGSEAVEFAAQMIRRVSGKPWLLAFSDSYLAAYGSAGKKSSDEWRLLDWAALAGPDRERCLDEINFEELGGFVFEPGGSGPAFVKFPPRALVQDIVRRVRQAGGLVAANEITTGMGRTGRWFGFQHYDIQPDLVALGKGLGNGYPVSAVAMRAGVAEKIEQSNLRYAQSHQNDPLGCAVAGEVIGVMREDRLVERGADAGAFFLEKLRDLAERYPLVKEARGRGMLLGLELQPHAHLTAEYLFGELLRRGFLVGFSPAGRMLRFDPALTMERETIQQLVDALEELLINAPA